MTFLAISPARALRAMFAIDGGGSGRLHRGDWLRLGCGTRPRIGMHVFDIADPRHIGRLDSIENSARCNVTWIETGWKSTGLPIGDLHAATEEE